MTVNTRSSLPFASHRVVPRTTNAISSLVLIDKTVPTLQQLQLQFPLGDTNARIITEVLWKAAFEIVNQIPIDKRQFAIELKPSELVEIFKLPTIRAKFDNSMRWRLASCEHGQYFIQNLLDYAMSRRSLPPVVTEYKPYVPRYRKGDYNDNPQNLKPKNSGNTANSNEPIISSRDNTKKGESEISCDDSPPAKSRPSTENGQDEALLFDMQEQVPIAAKNAQAMRLKLDVLLRTRSQTQAELQGLHVQIKEVQVEIQAKKDRQVEVFEQERAELTTKREQCQEMRLKIATQKDRHSEELAERIQKSIKAAEEKSDELRRREVSLLDLRSSNAKLLEEKRHLYERGVKRAERVAELNQKLQECYRRKAVYETLVDRYTRVNRPITKKQSFAV